jgi:hypothetical protein
MVVGASRRADLVGPATVPGGASGGSWSAAAPGPLLRVAGSCPGPQPDGAWSRGPGPPGRCPARRPPAGHPRPGWAAAAAGAAAGHPGILRPIASGGSRVRSGSAGGRPGARWGRSGPGAGLRYLDPRPCARLRAGHRPAGPAPTPTSARCAPVSGPRPSVDRHLTRACPGVYSIRGVGSSVYTLVLRCPWASFGFLRLPWASFGFLGYFYTGTYIYKFFKHTYNIPVHI